MSEAVEEIPLNDLNCEQGSEDHQNMNNNLPRVLLNFIIRRKTQIIITCGIVGLIFLIIFVGVHVIDKPINEYNNEPIVCTSNECKDIAKYVLINMNQSVNPCENFYDFVCKKEQRYSKHFMVNNEYINLMDSLINEIPDDTREYLKKLKQNFKACTDYFPNATDIKRQMNKIGSWPILNKGTFWNETEFQWAKTVHKLHREGIPGDYFMSMSFFTDLNNSSKKAIHLDQPVFQFDIQVLLQDMHSPTLQMYLNTMVNVTKALGVKENITSELEEILKFEIELAKISLSHKKRVDVTKLYKPVSVRDLEKKYPQIKWLDYINGILAPYEKIDDSEIIFIAVPFIDKFYDLMTNRKPSNRILANYIFWQATNDMGVQDLIKPLPKFIRNNPSFKSRRKATCTSNMMNNMPLATSALFVQYSDIDYPIEGIKNMSEKIRQAFYKIIEKNDWLDENMKNKVLTKISKINMLIGYPTELLNDTILDDYYKDLEKPSNSYVMNVLKFRRFDYKKQAENFKKPYDVADWTGKFGDVTKTNAVYGVHNAVYIYAGLAHPLFFDPKFPNYMNYGMLGQIVGHEITHSLSPLMRIYDENGNLRDDWWDSKNSEKYLNKTKCIVEKYNNYSYPEYGLSLNGTFTLDENAADINGLKAAYDAYIDYIENNPVEPHLPGLETWTPKQMFWIAFGTSWCAADESEDNIKYKILVEKHNPSRYRIIGSVTSIKEFAHDFNCRPTDVMNPTEKCSVWF